MAVDIIIPSVGESITSGILSRWSIKSGASVNKDDVVAELETDK
ncbi:MAG: dihydrolipoamide succinyltransferase, partial [Planctomycetota bacterium]|nr:dihydrolipoamide succinyltransferase [Planctomycetota bacterium]